MYTQPDMILCNRKTYEFLNDIYNNAKYCGNYIYTPIRGWWRWHHKLYWPTEPIKLPQ